MGGEFFLESWKLVFSIISVMMIFIEYKYIGYIRWVWKNFDLIVRYISND